MNFENYVKPKESSHKIPHTVIPRIHVQKKQIYEDRRQISGCTGNVSWGEKGGNEERRKSGMTANVYGVSFGR